MYISLDAQTLLHQARKDGFALTPELDQLLMTLGGVKADLSANTNVAAKFIDLCWADDPEVVQVLRISSEVFSKLSNGRSEDIRQIVSLVLGKLTQKRPLMAEHGMSWLVGHSLGRPYFEELLAADKEVRRSGKFRL